MYKPEPVVKYTDELIYRELQRIGDELARPQIDIAEFNILHSEPIDPKEGWVVRADGVDWNPGAGAGVYEYVGGLWNKL